MEFMQVVCKGCNSFVNIEVKEEGPIMVITVDPCRDCMDECGSEEYDRGWNNANDEPPPRGLACLCGIISQGRRWLGL